MSAKNRYTVTVSRINEGLHSDPYVTLDAHTIEVKPDGSLSIAGEKEGRAFSFGTWDGFTVDLIKSR